MGKYFRCRISEITETLSKNGIKMPQLQRGRPRKEITEEESQKINSYKKDFNTGYQRTAEAVTKHGTPVSSYKTHLVFEMDGLFTREKEFIPDTTHKKRFVARYVNQIWHTDLHYWDKETINEVLVDTFLIAFIDDRSRKIIHLEILKERTMKATAEALRKTLEDNPKPHQIVIDNGKEFIGKEFQEVLKSKGIKEPRIHVGEPEENGKIERFWGTLERTLIDRSKLQEFVDEYNKIWSHRGLKSIMKRKMTPEEAWRKMDHYEGRDDLVIDYYE